MSRFVEVVVIVEGPTEQKFIKDLLAPYLWSAGVNVTPIILDKPGEKGGDVKFARAKNDLEKHLKQRQDTFVTLMIDYYGIKPDWPGYQESKAQTFHARKAEVILHATAAAVSRLVPESFRPDQRFIPYISMHETEALYFSDARILAAKLGVDQSKVDAILAECGEPEQINDNRDTAPSSRLCNLFPRFEKTTTGLSIAAEIGIDKMRSACPIFDAWVVQLESLGESDAAKSAG